MKSIIVAMISLTLLVGSNQEIKNYRIYFPVADSTFQIIHHQNYSLAYSENHEQAAWIYYYLNMDSIDSSIPRKDRFKADDSVRTGSAKLSDYKSSGYDRGHLSPAADNKINMDIMLESFLMSNMSPQHPSFNRGIWKKLEENFRKMAFDKGPMHIVTAGILGDSLKTIGSNEVAIPEYYYKIAYQDSLQEMIAYLLKNEKSSVPLDSFLVSVDSIEALSGIDFFPQLEDSIENVLEGVYKDKSKKINYKR